MTDIDVKQLLLNIIDQAQEGKVLEFRYITSWSEFQYYKQFAKSTKLIIKILKASTPKLFKGYCKDVIAGISDVNKLLAYSKLCEAIDFYEKELNTLKQMLDDYDWYLGDGHFWYSFLGGKREL